MKKTVLSGERLALWMNASAYLFLIIGAVLMIMPFLWMLLTSVKSIEESTAMNPFVFLPTKLHFENYGEVIGAHAFLRLYWNTFAMMALRILCSLAFSAMAAYAFARLRFPGRDFLFSLVLVQMMVPTQIFIIPQYLMVDAIGQRNTIFALLFPGLVSAFGTFLLRQFFIGMPGDLENAAEIDGCNVGQTFLRVMMPLAKAGLVALSIFTALFAFKDLMWPLIVNTKAEASTLASALARIQSAYSVNYPRLMAASVLAIWPMIVLYFVFQKQFIRGISTSGIKL